MQLESKFEAANAKITQCLSGFCGDHWWLFVIWYAALVTRWTKRYYNNSDKLEYCMCKERNKIMQSIIRLFDKSLLNKWSPPNYETIQHTNLKIRELHTQLNILQWHRGTLRTLLRYICLCKNGKNCKNCTSNNDINCRKENH